MRGAMLPLPNTSSVQFKLQLASCIWIMLHHM